MVFIYVYSKQKRQQQQTNVPLLQAILMAMRTCWSNTRGIALCSMTRAIPKATGRHNRVTTRSVLPQWPPGQQKTKQHHKITPTLLDVLMTMAMCWYIIACIAQWRRPRASLEATGRHHWASIMSDNIKGTYLCQFCVLFFIVNMLKTGAKQKDGSN